MKNVTRTIIAALAFTATAFAYAGNAQEVNRSGTSSLEKIGVISSGSFTSLEELNAALAMKASDAGASHYRILSTSGKNKLSGTAVLYR